jgi:hypothetical protein
MRLSDKPVLDKSDMTVYVISESLYIKLFVAFRPLSWSFI